MIKTALSQVEPDYFKVPTTYELSGIVRERVFCYELYHQLRKLRNSKTTKLDLELNGEIDKRSHIDFDKKDRKNPDFVFHNPGTHERNTLVIEVKGKLHKRGIEKDFNTISTFIEKYEYKAGIFILYNHSIQELTEKRGKELKKFKKKLSANRIYILTIKSPEENCKVSLLSKLHI